MNIVITGASRGIGFEVARALSQMGNHSIVAISRNQQGLNALERACGAAKSEAHLFPLVFDLSEPVLFEEQLVPLIVRRIPRIDILINNAGFLTSKPFEQLTNSEMTQMSQINFTVAAQLIRATLPLLNSPSHVVNIGSMGGFQGSVKFPGLSVYSATKAALACLTECLAEEYKDSGIAFNCLALGAANTEMLREAFPGYLAPLSAEQMANFIVDFALNGNKYFNGKILPVSLSTP